MDPPDLILNPFPTPQAQRLPAPQCRSGTITDCRAASKVPDATEQALQQTPDTRLDDKRHFSPQRNLFPCACWGAARALLFTAPASLPSAHCPRSGTAIPPLLLLAFYASSESRNPCRAAPSPKHAACSRSTRHCCLAKEGLSWTHAAPSAGWAVMGATGQGRPQHPEYQAGLCTSLRYPALMAASKRCCGESPSWAHLPLATAVARGGGEVLGQQLPDPPALAWGQSDQTPE